MAKLSTKQLDQIATSLQPSLNAHLESLLQTRFIDLRADLETRIDATLKTKWDKLTAEVNANISSLKLTPAPPSTSKPPVLADCSYSGGHQPLRGFIHVMRGILSSRSTAFSDDSARINWVSRNFKPIGGPSNNWWMGLLQDNTVSQGVQDHYQFSGLSFITPPLSSLNSFFSAIVEEFGDKLAHETALKNLQDFKMGSLRIGDFNSQFKSLSGLVLDAPESIRMDYYKKALSAPVRRQAILRADWAQAQTLSAKMTIALLASQQLDKANGVTHSKHSHIPSTHQMISVPQNGDSMEIDAVHLSSNHPSFPKTFFIDECKRLKIFTRCLSPYNETHRTSSGSATCPNAAAPLQAKVDFLRKLRASILPKHVSHPPSGPPQPVQKTVAAVGQTPNPNPPTPFAYQPHLVGWGHPSTSYPPLQYGYPTYPTVAGQVPNPFSTYPPVPVPTPTPQPSATVSAVFSEYANLSSPVYYDLPGADYSDTPRTTELPPTPPPAVQPLSTQPPPSQSHHISAMTFTGHSSTDSRLILLVMLLVGKRLIQAKALIDSGSTGDFMNSLFATRHDLNLSPRDVPMMCIAFDGSPVAAGDVTHFWNGCMTTSIPRSALTSPQSAVTTSSLVFPG